MLLCDNYGTDIPADLPIGHGEQSHGHLHFVLNFQLTLGTAWSDLLRYTLPL